MVLKIIFLITILFSCSRIQSQTKNGVSYLNYQKINNSVLIRELDSYCSHVKEKADKVLRINYTINGDTTRYVFYYIVNSFNLICNPINSISKEKNILIAICNTSNNHFQLDSLGTLNFIKRAFPKQYQYFIQYKSYPPPSTGSVEAWHLIFYKDKLISKTIEENY